MREATLMNRNAALEAQVIVEGIQRHHRSSVGKIPQPILQGACSQQRLPVQNNLEVNIEKNNKQPFSAWSFKIGSVQTKLFLSLQTFFASSVWLNQGELVFE